MPNHSNPHKNCPGSKGFTHPGSNKDVKGRPIGPPNTDLDPPTGDLYLRKRSVRFKKAPSGLGGTFSKKRLPCALSTGLESEEASGLNWQLRAASSNSPDSWPFQPLSRLPDAMTSLATFKTNRSIPVFPISDRTMADYGRKSREQ